MVRLRKELPPSPPIRTRRKYDLTSPKAGAAVAFKPWDTRRNSPNYNQRRIKTLPAERQCSGEYAREGG